MSILIIVMMTDFIIENHPWKRLSGKRNAIAYITFPNEKELAVMKGVMDGESIQQISKKLNITIKDTKHLLSRGMRIAELKNLYDLILWGLKTGVIKDEPLPDAYKQISNNTNPSYAEWRFFLNQIITGQSDIPKSTQDNLKKQIAKHFKLGPSDAQFMRFVFQAMNPINPPKSVRGFKPHVPHFVKTGVSPKYAVIPSKFKPADIDPNLHPTYQPLKMGRQVGAQGGSIQMALKILGINPDVVKTPKNKVSFWQHKPEDLWHILELARTRFEYEIAHAHPDRGGDVNRAKQVNVAWKFVKDMFKRRGYELHK